MIEIAAFLILISILILIFPNSIHPNSTALPFRGRGLMLK